MEEKDLFSSTNTSKHNFKLSMLEKNDAFSRLFNMQVNGRS